MHKLVLALALGAAATVDVTADVKAWHAANDGSDPKAAGPRPRRLGDALDMEHLSRLAEEGQVGTELRFKLTAGTSAARAATVAAAMDCSSAKRVFRPSVRRNLRFGYEKTGCCIAV